MYFATREEAEDNALWCAAHSQRPHGVWTTLGCHPPMFYCCPYTEGDEFSQNFICVVTTEDVGYERQLLPNTDRVPVLPER